MVQFSSAVKILTVLLFLTFTIVYTPHFLRQTEGHDNDGILHSVQDLSTDTGDKVNSGNETIEHFDNSTQMAPGLGPNRSWTMEHAGNSTDEQLVNATEQSLITEEDNSTQVQYINTTQMKDFKNRANPIPETEWPRLDNFSCVFNASDDDLEEWQYRAPYALIIGAMKGGTSALNKFITEHSLVLETLRKEIHFFDFKFDDFATEDGILRSPARRKYGKIYKHVIAYKRLMSDPKKIAIDDSPRNLFWSDRIPSRVFCVTPWVKILAVLRNPVSRAFSQYNMQFNKAMDRLAARSKNSENPDNTFLNAAEIPTFEEWIEKDLNDLQATGVIQDSVSHEDFHGSIEEQAAWKAYTRSGTHAPIGRGLYDIQLRQWFQALEVAGKSRDEMMVIHSELMREEPDLVYQDILNFLGLPSEPLVDDEEALVGRYKVPLKEETRKKLEDFYYPFNKDLYNLLGDDWDGVWDPK